MAVPATVAAAQSSLYVGDLHPDITDTQLFQAFREFESLSSVRVCRDSMTRASLRYGYVNFMSQQDGITRSLYMRYSYTVTFTINNCFDALHGCVFFIFIVSLIVLVRLCVLREFFFFFFFFLFFFFTFFFLCVCFVFFFFVF